MAILHYVQFVPDHDQFLEIVNHYPRRLGTHDL